MATLNKQAVLRSHLETAIVLVSLENGYVSAHTIIMACEELLRTWYVAKDKYVPFDYRFYIKDEYQKVYISKIRERYNFFKHADRDIDATIDLDPEELHRLNEVLLAISIFGYRYLFSDKTAAMNSYGQWFAAAYPDFIQWSNVPGGEKLAERIRTLSTEPLLRRQALRVFLYSSGVLPKADLDILRLFN